MTAPTKHALHAPRVTVNANRPLLRDVIGFFGGGITAAVAAALIFLLFFPLPREPNPRDHMRADAAGRFFERSESAPAAHPHVRCTQYLDAGLVESGVTQ
jgi:hypothetical protein